MKDINNKQIKAGDILVGNSFNRKDPNQIECEVFEEGYDLYIRSNLGVEFKLSEEIINRYRFFVITS